MKKTILTLAIAAVASASALAQGTIAVYSTSGTFSTYTNSATYNSSLNGVDNTTQSKAGTTANSYYYALLFQTYTGTLNTIDPTSGAWNFGGYATNYLVAGGIRGAGAGSGAPVTGWTAPTGAAYSSAAENYYLLVGWSSNLGSTWSSVESQLASGTWSAQGLFGTSALGYSYAGAGPSSLPAVNIFGVSGGAPGGLANGITLYVTPTPEPGTMALAALGGASLLLFRRRK